MDCDLIFIDNSARMKYRRQTMESVGNNTPPETIVVIHDFEWKPYRKAITERFEHVVTFDVFTPQTGVAWNGPVLDVADVLALRDHIERLKSTEVTDTAAWSRALAECIR